MTMSIENSAYVIFCEFFRRTVIKVVFISFITFRGIP